MEHINFEGVNLAELLPRIPDSVKNGLPFGLVKLDMVGTILEYNMAEGDLTGVDPQWAIGKNFFDDVALCTKTQAFYGRFLEGVKKGFLNVVFDYTFDHREVATQVKVHMVTIPNHLGKKNVMILVKRSNKPLVIDAFSRTTTPVAAAPTAAPAPNPSTTPAAPSVEQIVNAVMLAMNQGTNTAGRASVPVQSSTQTPAAAPAGPGAIRHGSRHEDILKF